MMYLKSAENEANSTIKSKQKGFTIVEVLVSTVIFSLILLGAMAALVQVGRLYYKGITSARTQEQGRTIVAELSQAIQFSSQDVTMPLSALSSPPDPTDPLPVGPEIAVTEADTTLDAESVTAFLCVGPRRYTYAIDRKLSFTPDSNPVVAQREKEIRHVLWVDEPNGGCTQGASVSAADLTREDPCSLPADNCSRGRELLAENMRLSLFEIVQNDNEYSIAINIVYGDDDLLREDNGRYVCEGSATGGEFCALSELSTTVLKRI